MKKINVKVLAIAMAGTLVMNSCIGSFSLFNKYAKWQCTMSDSKFLNAIGSYRHILVAKNTEINLSPLLNDQSLFRTRFMMWMPDVSSGIEGGRATVVSEEVFDGRQLTMVKDEFKFSESQVYADIYIHKVKMMATVQEVFIANCKDYKFAKSKLARLKIANISEKEISLIKPDGKTQVKMTWVKFYQHYHGNLNELIIKFIEKGKNVCKLSDGKRLSLQPWADAMMGAALTMQIICGDDPTVTTRAEQIAKNAVKELPEYLNRAKAIFPDMQFDAVPEE